MASVIKRNNAQQTQMQPQRRFGSERQVSEITGFSERTLQKDRLLQRDRFPWYKVGGKVLYDLNEVERIITSNVQGRNAAA